MVEQSGKGLDVMATTRRLERLSAADLFVLMWDDFGWSGDVGVLAILDGTRLVTEATSFGGLHTTADRRARWGDDVPAGLVRLSAGTKVSDTTPVSFDWSLQVTAPDPLRPGAGGKKERI